MATAFQATPGEDKGPAAPAPPTEQPTAAAIAAVVAADPKLESTTLALPTDALDYLRTEAKKRGISTGDMVRVAIGTQKYLTDSLSEEGASLQLRTSKGVYDLKV